MQFFGSNPLRKEDEDNIIRKSNEILEEFAKEFPKWHAASILKRYKDDLKGHVKEKSEFSKAPLAAEPLKKGYLFKSGVINKGWKKRFIVVGNRKSNFKIEYFESDGHGLKGTINPCGYYADAFDSNEERTYGLYGIKLVPLNPLRRTWFFRAESDSEQNEWHQIMDNACSRCEPNRNANPFIAQAFERTFDRLRHMYREQPWHVPYGNEADQLRDFVALIVSRDVISFSSSDAPATGIFKRIAANNSIETTATKLITDLVSPVWTSVIVRAEESSEHIEVLSRGHTKQIVDDENLIKRRIIDSIASSLRPFVAEHSANLLRPVVESIAYPLATAFALSAKYFYSTMTERYRIGELNTPPKRMSNVRALARSTEYYWNKESLLYSPAHTIASLYEQNPDAEILFPAGSFTLVDMKHTCIENVRSLAIRALHQLIRVGRDMTTGRIEGLIVHITRLYIELAKQEIWKTLKYILKQMMVVPLDRLWTPCIQVCAPLKELVERLPTPGVSQLLSVQCLLYDVINDVIDRSIDAVIDSAKPECEEIVDKVKEEMGLPEEPRQNSPEDFTAEFENMGVKATSTTSTSGEFPQDDDL